MTPTINVIHDPTNLQRGALLAKEIAKNNLEVRFWPALKNDISGAHRQVVNWAKENKLKEVAIFEDDFFFPSENGFEYFLSQKPKSFDIFLCGLYNDFGQLPNEGNIVKRFAGFTGYILHSRYFDFFLSADTTNQSLENALGQLALQGFGKFVVCFPYSAIQHEQLESTNDLHKGMRFPHSSYFKAGQVYGY